MTVKKQKKNTCTRKFIITEQDSHEIVSINSINDSLFELLFIVIGLLIMKSFQGKTENKNNLLLRLFFMFCFDCVLFCVFTSKHFLNSFLLATTTGD